MFRGGGGSNGGGSGGGGECARGLTGACEGAIVERRRVERRGLVASGALRRRGGRAGGAERAGLPLVASGTAARGCGLRCRRISGGVAAFLLHGDEEGERRREKKVLGKKYGLGE